MLSRSLARPAKRAMKPYAYFTLNTHYGESGIGMTVPALAVSVGYLVLTSLLALVVRRLVTRLSGSPLTRLLLQEAVAAAEMCACCFELIIIADNYGVWMYALFLFLLTIWWSLNWGEATACPYTHLEEVVQGNSDLVNAALKSAAELVGGVYIFRYIQKLWALELAETHIGKATEECTADLQVPMFIGAAVEGAATCLCRLMSKALSDRNVPFAPVIDAFFSTALVVAAFDYTGGYFNPVLATSLKYGCKGNTFEEHVIVYWVGACLGAVGSLNLYQHPTVQQLIFPAEKTD